MFTGANSTNTSSNANTLNPAVVALDNSTDITLPTTYTGTSGNQTRGASTLDDSNWYIGDQGGIYTNGTTRRQPERQFPGREDLRRNRLRLHGFRLQPSPSGTLSAPSGSTFTPLPGLPDGTTNAQDFYLIQSGSNGSTFDVLYVLSASSATAGTIAKYSLVSGSWTANGSYTTSFGGFGLAAANNGSGGASLYVTTGTGATTANQVIELPTRPGSTPPSTSQPRTMSRFTRAARALLLKGIAFAPVSTTANNVRRHQVTPLNAGTSQPITFTATVTANSGSAGSGGGVVKFIDSGASGTVSGHRRHRDHERRHLDL